MKRMRPQFRSSIPARYCRESRTPLITFISKRRYHSASGISANGLGSKMPTLFTSTSTAGSFAITASAPAEPEKSAAMPSTLAAAACDRIASTAASTRSCVRPFTWTCAPSLASDLAIANPIPAVDPVTRTIFPVSLRSTSFSCRKAAPSCRHVVGSASSRLLPVPCRFPFDPLQIEYKDGVEDWDQQQGDERCDGQSADLCVAQRFPERATFKCERKQSKDRRGHCDHHRSNTLDSGIRKSAFQRFALFVHLLNEVEQHDDMAYDDSNQAGHSKKCHESKGRSHDCQSDQCTNRPIGSGRKDQQRLDGIVELNKERQVDPDQRNQKNDGEIRESVNLLRLFPADL